MAIRLNFSATDRDLTGRSKMWGCPDMPDTLEYPELMIEEDGETYTDPLTFICQIRLEDIASLDRENRLPHTGMLYFFAGLDYYLGNLDAPSSSGMGEWDSAHFRVLYSPVCENLHTHRIVYDDGTDYGIPAEAIEFSECEDKADGFKLLGQPFFGEVEDECPGCPNLLQLDSDDKWGLRFYDCGMLNFLQDGDEVICYLHSC